MTIELVMLAILDAIEPAFAAGLPAFIEILKFKNKKALFGGQGDRATKN